MPKKPLRAVGEDERPESPAAPKTLLEAVESGDVLAIHVAQRRLMAEKLLTAAENTAPQYSNEINKLTALITAEESRRKAFAEQEAAEREVADEAFDASAI